MSEKAISKHADANTGVFWDIVDCPIPCGLEFDPDSIYANIKLGLGELSTMTIWAYAGKVPETMFNDYNEVGITMQQVIGDQSARVDRMKEDIYSFAHENNYLCSSLMVIAKDILEDEEFIRFCDNYLKAGLGRRILVGTHHHDAIRPVEHRELAHISTCIVPEPDNSVEAALSKELAYANIGVYWDIMDCPIPKGLNPDSIYANIRLGLGIMGYHGELTDSWGYASKVSSDMFDDYDDAGILMEESTNSERAHKMANTILLFALDNPYNPSNLLVIADDMPQKPELMRVLQVLKQRNINVVVAQPDKLVPIELHNIASCVCLSTSLLARGKATLLEVNPENKNVLDPSFLDDSAVPKKLKLTYGNTGVFWDTKDCPNPNALEVDFCSIDKSIKLGLASMDKSGSRVTSISAYDDGGNISVWNGGTDAIMVSHKGDRLKRMALDILLWALDNRVGQYPIGHRQPNVIVVSKNLSEDEDFVKTLHYLSGRQCNVIFGVPDEVKIVSFL
ncbi:unnamed protein product [Microthlaspi erraticum]|uniref:NYN domain-containing protein n=1 Tax=Microthlaspi erraticum TaxID=1685480 RepID=A0A6D2IUR2_9BRAS|nr:unnamed protein product [Microthlaspi erraticum]CAA7047273.1 unnamed protein product [Microthlaspi erraticum]